MMDDSANLFLLVNIKAKKVVWRRSFYFSSLWLKKPPLQFSKIKKKKQQMKKLMILSLFLGSISFNVHGHLPDLDNALLWDCVNFIDKPSRMYNPNSMFLQYQILPNFTAIYSRLASGTLLNSIYESLFHISHTNILVCAHLIIAPCLALLFQGRDRTGIPSKKWLSSQTATPTVGLTLCWRRENFNVVEVRK